MASLNTLIFLLCLSLFLGLPDGVSSKAVCPCGGTGTCKNGCSSASAFGFEPEYCGHSCSWSCAARPECGQAVEIPSMCPLDEGECKDGTCEATSNGYCPIISGCNATVRTAHRRIGFFETWSKNRACDTLHHTVLIAAKKWTHINVAFALIDPQSFRLGQMHDHDLALYAELTDLKRRNPGLQVYISVAGAEMGGASFADVVATEARRAAFVRSARALVRTYAFDGIDLHFMNALGSEDKAVELVKELRAELGKAVGITVTVPTKWERVRGVAFEEMDEYVSWFNILGYDYEGSQRPSKSHTLQPHTNLTEIHQTVNLLWVSGIQPSKMVLGLNFHARTATLQDPTCTHPNCPALASGTPGSCTNTPGFLSYAELSRILDETDAQPEHDLVASAKYITLENNQWMSYDDAETFTRKLAYVNYLCLGGVAAWALDLDDWFENSAVNALLQAGNDKPVEFLEAMNHNNALGLHMFWTPCLPRDAEICPPGWKPLAFGRGKVFDADLTPLQGIGCIGGGRHGLTRALCIPSTAHAHCQWSPSARSKRCTSTCPAGLIPVTKNSHIGYQDRGCRSGKYVALCCETFEVAQGPSEEVCYGGHREHVLSGGLALRSRADGEWDYWYEGERDIVEEREVVRERDRGWEGECRNPLPWDEVGVEVPIIPGVLKWPKT